MKNDYEIRGDVTAIFIRRKDCSRIEALISTSDLEKVKSFTGTWFLNTNLPNRNLYVVSKESVGHRKQKLILLHRFILNAGSEFQVDHVNHNTLDNIRKNLRIVTRAENQQNRIGCNKTSKSGIRGVYWDKRKKRWKAEIQLDNKNIYIGRFKEIDEAEKAIIKARRELMPFSIYDLKEEVANDY